MTTGVGGSISTSHGGVSPARRALRPGVIWDNTIPAVPLRLVETHISRGNQSLRADPTTVERCATETDGDGQGQVVDAEGRARSHSSEAHGEPTTPFDVDSPKQNRKLLTTDPRKNILGPDLSDDPASQLLEHGIADGMPVSVIEGLEVVDVEHDQAQVRSVPATERDFGL